MVCVTLKEVEEVEEVEGSSRHFRRPFSYDYLNIISLVVWNLHELNNHFLL